MPKLNTKQITESVSKVRKGSGMHGDGKIRDILFKAVNAMNKPWAKKLLKFASGVEGSTPVQLLTIIHKVLNHLATQLKKHPDMKHLAPQIMEHSNFIKRHIPTVKGITEVLHVKQGKGQSGAGLKRIFSKVRDFLTGHTKVKPSQVLNGIAKVAGVGAMLARAAPTPQTQAAAAVLSKVAVATRAVGAWFKQRGAGRHLEGRGKSGASCSKKNPAKKICCGSGKFSNRLKSIPKEIGQAVKAELKYKYKTKPKLIKACVKQYRAKHCKGKPPLKWAMCVMTSRNECKNKINKIHKKQKGVGAGKKKKKKKASVKCVAFIKVPKKKLKGKGISAGGALRAGGALSGGSKRQKGGYLFQGDAVKAGAFETYKSCKRSMRNSGHSGASRIRRQCRDATLNYGKAAANYTGSALEMRARICPRIKGLE